MTRQTSATVLALGIALAAAPLLLPEAHAQGMSVNEAKGNAISGEWRGSGGLVTKGPDGKVVLLYGEVQTLSGPFLFQFVAAVSSDHRAIWLGLSQSGRDMA